MSDKENILKIDTPISGREVIMCVGKNIPNFEPSDFGTLVNEVSASGAEKYYIVDRYGKLQELKHIE